MKTPRDKLHLLHIRDAVDQIAVYTNNISFRDFGDDKKTYDAVLMQIVVIGEAANSISDVFKEKHPDLAWRGAVGMRNTIAHGYLTVKPELIWDTVKKDLPKLKADLEKILE